MAVTIQSEERKKTIALSHPVVSSFSDITEMPGGGGLRFYFRESRDCFVFDRRSVDVANLGASITKGSRSGLRGGGRGGESRFGTEMPVRVPRPLGANDMQIALSRETYDAVLRGDIHSGPNRERKNMNANHF